VSAVFEIFVLSEPTSGDLN